MIVGEMTGMKLPEARAGHYQTLSLAAKGKWGESLSPSCAGCRNGLMKGKRNERPE